jgi:hypothetical protein
MPDRDDPNTFETFILESTPESQQGVSYRLKEDLEYGTDFYKTGVLKFRKV